MAGKKTYDSATERSTILRYMNFKFKMIRFGLKLFLIGEKQLLQFRIHDPVFKLVENGSKLKAEFTMQRNPSYMIINAYIPSSAIMLMTIVPLYLREDTHFATSITLVLTSILVLFTTIQSSVSHTPKTAYLKMIDYWNLLSLAVTLANFFTLVLWEISDHDRRTDSNWKQIKWWMRLALPLITLISLMIYWIIAAAMYFEHI